jgi:hypothetical protein
MLNEEDRRDRVAYLRPHRLHRRTERPYPDNRLGIGSVWQCPWWSRQCFSPHHQGMTSTSISARPRHTDATRWRSIRADLVFWTIAGAVVAAFSGPLADWWNVPRTELLVGGLSFLVVGVGLLLGLSRVRPTPRALVAGFGVSNLLLAPTLWAAASLGWLPLSAAGNWALADAGAVALGLGVWQLTASRR